MLKKNVLKWIVVVVFILSMNVMLFLTAVQSSAFDIHFYEKKYEEYHVLKNMQITKQELMEVTREMLLYLKGKRKDLEIAYVNTQGKQVAFFNEKEKKHMEDVQDLFYIGFWSRNIAILCCLTSYLFLRKLCSGKEFFHKVLLYSAITPIILMVVLISIVSQNFDRYFTYFHEIFFTNTLWLLDPSTDRLIQMLPLSFFSDISFTIGMKYVVLLTMILFSSILLLIKKRNYF